MASSQASSYAKTKASIRPLKDRPGQDKLPLLNYCSRRWNVSLTKHPYCHVGESTSNKLHTFCSTNTLSNKRRMLANAPLPLPKVAKDDVSESLRSLSFHRNMPRKHLEALITRKLIHRSELLHSMLRLWDMGTRFFWEDYISRRSLRKSRSLPCLSLYYQKIRQREHLYLRQLMQKRLLKCVACQKGHCLLHISNSLVPSPTLSLSRVKMKSMREPAGFCSRSFSHLTDTPVVFLNQRTQAKCISALYLLESDFVVRALIDEIMPSDQERYIKRCIVRSLTSLIKMWKGDTIQACVAGSTAYDVDCTASDLDVVLITSEKEYSLLLEELSCIILKCQQDCCGECSHKKISKWFPDSVYGVCWPLRSVKLQLVDNARVPILLLKCPHGVVCDISVNTNNSISHTNFFKAILREKPHLRALMRLVKFWVKIRRIPVTRDGGLPNIVWMLLCVFASRHTEICYSSSASALAYNQCNHSNEVSEVDVTRKKLLERFASPFTRWMWSLNLSFSQTDILSLYTVLLSEFFSRLGTRDALTCTVSVAAGVCIPKNPLDVAQRVLSPPWFGGVWDELISVEDPACFNEKFFPEALLSPPSMMMFSELAGPNIAPNGIPTPMFKDLVTRVSSATWLVYQYELRRANTIMGVLVQEYKEFLFHFQNQSPECRRPFLKHHLNRFVDLFTLLFTENLEERYRVPAIVAEQPQTLNSDVISNDSVKSPLSKTMWAFNLALILLDGKLMLAQLNKVCGDTSGWWSTEFLTRRDVRSVLHGKPVFAVSVVPNTRETSEKSCRWVDQFSSTSKRKSESSPKKHWFLCNYSLYQKLLQLEHGKDMKTDGVQTDSSLLESQQNNDCEILFNPCNLVCFLRFLPLKSKQNSGLPSNYDLFLLPFEEVEKIELFTLFAKEAPYWYTNVTAIYERFSGSASRTFSYKPIQPAVRVCKHCKATGLVDFNDDLGLPHHPLLLVGSLSHNPLLNQHNLDADSLPSCSFSSSSFSSSSPTMNPISLSQTDTSALAFLKTYFFEDFNINLLELDFNESHHNTSIEKKIFKSLSCVTKTLNYLLSQLLKNATQGDSEAQVSSSSSSSSSSELLSNTVNLPIYSENPVQKVQVSKVNLVDHVQSAHCNYSDACELGLDQYQESCSLSKSTPPRVSLTCQNGCLSSSTSLSPSSCATPPYLLKNTIAQLELYGYSKPHHNILPEDLPKFSSLSFSSFPKTFYPHQCSTALQTHNTQIATHPEINPFEFCFAQSQKCHSPFEIWTHSPQTIFSQYDFSTKHSLPESSAILQNQVQHDWRTQWSKACTMPQPVAHSPVSPINLPLHPGYNTSETFNHVNPSEAHDVSLSQGNPLSKQYGYPHPIVPEKGFFVTCKPCFIANIACERLPFCGNPPILRHPHYFVTSMPISVRHVAPIYVARNLDDSSSFSPFLFHTKAGQPQILTPISLLCQPPNRILSTPVYLSFHFNEAVLLQESHQNLTSPHVTPLRPSDVSDTCNQQISLPVNSGHRDKVFLKNIPLPSFLDN